MQGVQHKLVQMQTLQPVQLQDRRYQPVQAVNSLPDPLQTEDLQEKLPPTGDRLNPAYGVLLPRSTLELERRFIAQNNRTCL